MLTFPVGQTIQDASGAIVEVVAVVDGFYTLQDHQETLTVVETCDPATKKWIPVTSDYQTRIGFTAWDLVDSGKVTGLQSYKIARAVKALGQDLSNDCQVRLSYTKAGVNPAGSYTARTVAPGTAWSLGDVDVFGEVFTQERIDQANLHLDRDRIALRTEAEGEAYMSDVLESAIYHLRYGTEKEKGLAVNALKGVLGGLSKRILTQGVTQE